MSSTDWGRLDNLPYKPAGEFAKFVSDYSTGIAKGLEASMQVDLAMANAVSGGAKKGSHKKCGEKVKIGKKEHCIYLGPRGGKYIRMNGEFKLLSSIKK